MISHLREELDLLSGLYQELGDAARKDGKMYVPKSSPIRDGVARPEEYLKADLKVVWLLKEPYDSGEGVENDGGWSIVDNCFAEAGDSWERKREDGSIDRMWTNRTWQMVAYIMYGFRHELRYKDMPRVRSPEGRMIMNELLTIGWVNASKFANKKSSSDAKVLKLFINVWAPLVMKQLHTLKPNVIVCGKTFNCLRYVWNDALACIDGMLPGASARCPKIGFWKHNDTYIIDAYHPGRKGCQYANSIINALRIIKKFGVTSAG